MTAEDERPHASAAPMPPAVRAAIGQVFAERMGAAMPPNTPTAGEAGQWRFAHTERLDMAPVRPPAPIRVDAEQLSQALQPLVDALNDIQRVLLQFAPAVEELGRQMQHAEARRKPNSHPSRF